MTNDDHRRLGRILGYPDCCVSAWIDDRVPFAGIRRGGIKVERSDEEIQAIKAELGSECEKYLTPYRHWVPCPDCMDHENWLPYVYPGCNEGNQMLADQLLPEFPSALTYVRTD